MNFQKSVPVLYFSDFFRNILDQFSCNKFDARAVFYEMFTPALIISETWVELVQILCILVGRLAAVGLLNVKKHDRYLSTSKYRTKLVT